MKRKISFILSMLFCLLLLPSAAFAAQRNVEVELPVKVSVSGEDIPASDTYTFRISAKDDAPLPNGVSYMEESRKGEGTVNFSSISFERVGIYQYSVSQIAGDEERCHYDSKIYDITITVTNAVDDDSLEATIAIRDSGSDSGMKDSEIEFKNTYDALPVLPDTGGSGVFQMYIIGIVLLFGSFAGLMLSSLYKKNETRDE